MSVSREKVFQLEICEYLADNGWLWTPPTNLDTARDGFGGLQVTDATGYSKDLGLFPEDVFEYLKETQPVEWEKLFPKTKSDVVIAKTKVAFLKKVADRLDRPYRSGGGLGNILTQTFNFTHDGVTAKFKLAQMAPENNANLKLVEMYHANRLRVIHELQYSEYKKDRIDLVFFLNGIPVVTTELKNGVTETYFNAVTQYKEHRTPYVVNSAGKHIPKRKEPLLDGSRAIAHFAVDPETIYMTTKLNGERTNFLPFNAGGDSENPAANKANGTKPRTAYFWEDILHRHTFLNILRSFVVQTVKDVAGENGVRKTEQDILFPRYHQLFGTVLAVAVTLREDVGHNSLMMWSAGSGKSNGISWLAHALNSLHYESIPYAFENLSPRMQVEVRRFVSEKLHDKKQGKVFTGGGFVITDKTVLDSQIGDTVKLKDSPDGTVVQIGKNMGGAAKSKTQHLAAEMEHAGSSIKIITAQTFPYAFEAITSKPVVSKKPKTYFIIRDEAHASEGGKNTQALLELINSTDSDFLTPAEKADYRKRLSTGDADEAEIVAQLADQQVIASQKAKSNRTKVSYFAYTATPRAVTIEMFGRTNPDEAMDMRDNLVPLHHYGMEQAIKEGFILDVMRNYCSYELSFKLSVSSDEEQREVEAREGKRKIMDWVQHQAETLGQKAEIIIEHYQDTVFPSLSNGKAQAMVFTSSRLDALLYKRALDYVIESKGLRINTLVAFSGEVEDPETGELVTEKAANKVSGSNMATIFEKGEYHILIVANKYQTGYDNVRLVGGYIDKKLKGVEAVQTASRLNRIAPALKKTEVYIVDFANEAEDIMAAFNQYYTTLSLDKKSDPNALHDLEAQIEQYSFYEQEELQAWVNYWFVNDSTSGNAIIANIKGRFDVRKEQAHSAENKPAVDYYAAFLPLLKQYVQVYRFQSTMVDYGDSQFEKQALFYAEIYTKLSNVTTGTVEAMELDGVQLVHTSFRKRENNALIYEPTEVITTAEVKEIRGATPETPEMVRLKILINYINELFGESDIPSPDLDAFQAHLLNKMVENTNFISKARSNSVDKLITSNQVGTLFNDILMDMFGSYEKMVSHIHQTDIRADVLKLLIPVAWDKVKHPSR